MPPKAWQGERLHNPKAICTTAARAMSVTTMTTQLSTSRTTWAVLRASLLSALASHRIG
jgi:hypothetical protein